MIFSKRYKIYLDVICNTDYDDPSNPNWFECFPLIKEVKRGQFEKELFTRKSFGIMEFKNNPEEYSTAIDKRPYSTYDLILNQPIESEIRIKIVFSSNIITPVENNTMYGYWGSNDCEFDDDKKLLTVTPNTLDQYTDLVENMKTKVNIFPDSEDKNATWIYDHSLFETEGVTGTHNMPVKLNVSDLTEANAITIPYETGSNSSILNGAVLGYNDSFKINLNAAIDVTGGAITLMLNIYDANGGVASSQLLQTFGTSGNINTSYNKQVLIGKGQYVRLVAVVPFDSFITYSNVDVTLLATTIPYDTNSVYLKMLETHLQTITVLSKDLGAAFSTATTRDQYQAEVVNLDNYFEPDGSPKESLLSGNTYAPYSGRKNFTVIKAEDGKVIDQIEGLYIPDFDTAYDTDGYEVSEIELFEHHFQAKSPQFLNFNLVAWIRVYAEMKMSRFEILTPVGEEPSGSGWKSTTYESSPGLIMWVKKPFDGVDYGWTKDDLVNENGTLGGVTYRARVKSSKLNNYPDGDTSVAYPSRDLRDVIQDVFSGTHETYLNSEVKSVFFWNDADPLLSVDAGINYVTKGQNWLNRIACIHTYQMNENRSGDSTDSVLEVTFSEFMDDLKKLFNYQIYWWVDEDKNLRIEHISYIDLTRNIMDLTVAPDGTKNKSLLTEISVWAFEKSEMFSSIEYNMSNSGYKDFTNNKSTFDKIVSNKRNQDIKETVETKTLTTDVRYCIENQTDLENGIVLVCHDEDYVVRTANVPIADKEWENGNLSYSNLLVDYKYEGVFLNGKINGKQHEFDIAKRTRIGNDILIKGLYDYDYYKTKLGVGLISNATQQLDAEDTKLKLKYRFGSGSESDTFTLMVNFAEDFDGAVDTQFNFG